MQIAERAMLGPGFERRLSAVLDRVAPPTPLFAAARYRSMMPPRSSGIWRLVPAAVGIAAIVVMATSATVETGSANPAVWTQRAAATIQTVRHLPDSKPAPNPVPPSSQPADTSRPVPAHSADTKPTPETEPSDGPERSTTPASSPLTSDDSNPPDSNDPSRDSSPRESGTSDDRGGDSGGSSSSDFSWAQRS
jgi:outer membrane biosynthesis protein TonB